MLLDNTAMIKQDAAGIGERDAAAVAVEQVVAQLSFQQADLAAEQWLGDAEEVGSAGVAAEFGHVHEVF